MFASIQLASFQEFGASQALSPEFNCLFGFIAIELRDSLPYLRERFFLELSRGDYNASLAAVLGVEGGWKTMYILLHSIDRKPLEADVADESQTQIHLLALRQMLENHFAAHFRMDTFFNGNKVAALLYLTPAQNYGSIEKAWLEFQEKVREAAEFTFSVGISRNFDEIKKLPAAYGQAQQALKQRLYFGDGAMGFSTSTCLSARRQSTAISAWQYGGVQMLTTSMDGSLRISLWDL